MKERKSTVAIAQELFRRVESDDFSVIEKQKNPFILMHLSKLIHGKL